MIGRTIAHYRVIEKIGEGGMGSVWKAVDDHLDRLVALKILPVGKTADTERRKRFVQEAKAASALNHPNIIHIYDIASTDGVDYIAMEYVPGHTLADLIGRKGLRLSEALNYGVQITDALSKAHSSGIVHRDLKPSNIMVTPDGLVKVLDFGLAKLTEPEADADATTVTGLTGRPRTQDGAIVGTIAYMSPEQAEGKEVDARSDVFSFGSVLYEMLTGRRAFHGESKVSTLAAILHSDPKPPGEISSIISRDVERALTRCLRKDPQRRWQTMSDLKIALQDAKEESESGAFESAAVARKPSRFGWGLVAAGLLLLGAIVAAGVWLSSPNSPTVPDLKAERFTFDSGLTFSPAISRDGKFAAYSSDRAGGGNLDIYVQHTASGQPNRLTKHPADDYHPSFSPDGSRIAFRSDRDGGGIYVVDTLGGDERRLVQGGFSPSFSPDGSIIAYVQRPNSSEPADTKIMLIPSEGGQPRQFRQNVALSGSPLWRLLLWSPEGNRILFQGSPDNRSFAADWWVAPLDGSPPTAVEGARQLAMPFGLTFPLAWFRDEIYYCRGSLVEGMHLTRVPINPATLKFSGPPRQLSSGGGSHISASISAEGRLLFPIVFPSVDFVAVPLEATKPLVGGQALKLTENAAIKGHASLSRDGNLLNYVAYVSWTAHRVEIRTKNLSTGRESAYVSKTLPTYASPQISPDGTKVAYSDVAGGSPASFVGVADSLPGDQVCSDCRIVGWYSDSRRMLVQVHPHQLLSQSLATGARTTILDTSPARLYSVQFRGDARLSYDDRWIAFTVAVPGGDVRLFVAPLRDTAPPQKDWIQIAGGDSFGWSPVWSPDGNILYFVSLRDGHACAWAQPLDHATKRPVGDARAIQHFHQPGASDVNFARSTFLLGAPGKLIVNNWSVTGNLWMANLDPR